MTVLLLIFTTSLLSAAPPADRPPDETVVVTATRLIDRGTERRDVPAHVSVITSEEIAASGARTVQEALALEAGVVAYDQVGNAVQTTVDWRGFSSGSGAVVYLDGTPMNDSRNNLVALETLPVDAVDRIEITRGSAAALAGGGSESAVVNVVTRRAARNGAGATAALGGDATRRLTAEVAGASGSLDLLASASYDRTGGFRENADGDQTRWAVNGGLDLGSSRRLSLSISGSRLDYGNPGALTRAEFESDPESAPYNRIDRTDGSSDVVALRYGGGIARGLSLAANAFWRRSDVRTVTTGRAAAAFGRGFDLATDGTHFGSAVQLTHEAVTRRGGSLLAAGVEGLDGSVEATGFYFRVSDPEAGPDSPVVVNTAGTRRLAVFVQERWSPTERLHLHGGVRFDSDEVAYEESGPSRSRLFEETSARAGATWGVAANADLYASYGEAFLPPTAEQLFAFPGFGSNPDLAPQLSRAYETGARVRREALEVDVAVFRVDTQDEIVFDPTPLPDDPYGRNVNARETRRQGLEATVRGKLSDAVNGRLGATWTRATFRNGPDAGRTTPLVPEARLTGSIAARLPRGFGLRADGLWVGSQVLDNDAANAQERLPDYLVVNTRMTWTDPRGAWTLFVEARNLLDRKYATRGIYAFDWTTLENAVFVTPAPGRRLFAGAGWTH